MTCGHCCDANHLFDDKQARKDLKKYKKKGAGKPTQRLIDGFSNIQLSGLSLLDIGGGIGIISLELFKLSLSKSMDVDASFAYVDVARKHAEDAGYESQTEFIIGDFVDHSEEIDLYDIVTLDKVVCCYPDIDKLLQSSLNKAKQYYGIVYPRDGFIARILTRLANFYFKLKGSEFRTYVHENRLISTSIENEGFERIYFTNSFPWRIAIYRRLDIVD